MIISDITGGLGNQMFQFAVGRALAQKFEQPLLLDTSSFNKNSLHQGFELKRIFKLAAKVATKDDIDGLLGWQSSRKVRRCLIPPAMSGFRKKSLVVEPHFHYWSGIESVPRNCYLQGYWQSEQYFESSASEISKDFTFLKPITDANLELAEKISQVNAVSVHVRRGDYVSNPLANFTHGVCTLDYYTSAIRRICDSISDPHFFIFSDDIRWVRENMDLNFLCSYVDHNRLLNSFIDMRLMSICQHNIIANSSFSWWAAWLNHNPRKIVIAPKKWFVGDKDSTDLIPSTWVSL